jgi:3-isopropylmalate/(R)-2-methylmalate dehydratase small subunit
VQPEPITRVSSRAFILAEENVDTDQIIPARFLTATERGSLADACFRDWRFSKDGAPNAHPLNAVDTDERAILLAGHNFGCGSSREHAPWALRDFGVRAVVTSGAGDIFKSNAAKNGLVVAEIGREAHAALTAAVTADPDTEITVDVEGLIVSAPGVRAGFELEPFARSCLVQGVDPLGFILGRADAIAAYEAALP